MESLKIVSSPIPFSNKQETKLAPIGSTLLDAVNVAVPERYVGNVAVIAMINGDVIKQDCWHLVRPKLGTIINMRVVPMGGGGKKNPLATILSIAVLIAAPALGAAYGAALGASIGLTGATAAAIGSAIITGVVSVVGSMLINAIAPPPKQKANFGDPSESPTLFIQGARNSILRYGSVPVCLGTNRMVPPQAALPYTENQNNRQFVRQLFTYGFGENVRVSDIRIGDTPLSDFTDYDIEHFTSGNLNSGGRLWSNSVNQTDMSVLLRNADGWVERTVPPDSNEVIVDINFARGLVTFDENGKRTIRNVRLDIQYRPVGTTNWIGGIEFQSYSGASFTPSEFRSSDYRRDSVVINLSTGVISYLTGYADSRRGLGIGGGRIVSGRPATPNGSVKIADVDVRSTRSNLPPYNWTTQVVVTDARDPAVIGSRFQNSSSFVPSLSGGNVVISGGSISNDPLNISAASAEAVIRSHRIVFPSRGNYEIRIRRVTADSTNEKIIDNAYLVAIKGIRYERPVSASGLNGVAIRIKATDQLNGALDQLNMLVTNIIPDYDKDTDTWYPMPTSNPASIYRYVLQGAANGKPLDDSKIDLESLQEWHTYCEERGYSCNFVADSLSSVDDVLRIVASAGSASPAIIDGKRSIVVDRGGKDIVQVVTPRNSWNYTGAITYPEMPDAFRVTFRNADAGYIMDERIVYNSGFSAANATLFEELQLVACTNSDLAYKSGKRFLAIARLRPETHTFNMDVENLVMTRGDRIKFQNDVPLVGLGQGRIKSLDFDSSGDVVGFVLDDGIGFTSSGLFYVRIRHNSDGTQTYVPITAQESGYSNHIQLQTPLTPPNIPEIGDLCAVTTAGGELDLIVSRIEPESDLTARITCLNYAPEIFDAETGEIPEFNSVITTPLEFIRPDAPILLDSQSDESVMIRNVDGSFTSVAAFTLRNRNDGDIFVDVRYRASGATEFQTARVLEATPERVVVTGLDDGMRYDIWIRYKRANGSMYSEPLQINDYLFIGASGLPSDVTKFRINVVGQTAIFSWDENDDIDFSHYEMRFSTSTSGATWDTAQVLESFINQNRYVTFAQSGTYFVKSVDLSGNYSENATIVSTHGLEGVLNAIEILQESPDFSGVKENTVVIDNGLALANVTPPFTPPSSQYLHDIFPSTVFDLDARMADSYGGTGNTWFNLCENPADGSLQSAYNFTRRGTQTFVGDVGSPSAHFLSNGTGGWNAPMTPFVANLARTDLGVEYSAAFVFRTPPTTFTANNGLLGAASNLVVEGVYSAINNAQRIVWRHNNGTSGITVSPITTFTTSNHYIVIISVNSTTGSVLITVNGNEWFNGTVSWLTNTTPSAVSLFGLFASNSGVGFPWPSGSQFIAASLFNSSFTSQQCDMLNNFYQGRPYVGYGEGYYYFDKSIDLTGVFSSYLSASLIVGGDFKNDMFLMDDLFEVEDLFGIGANDMFAMDDLFAENDLFGIGVDGWLVELQMRFTNDDPSIAPVWTDWQPFRAGSETFRAAEFRVYMKSYQKDVTPIVFDLSVTVDMPDRIERGDDLVVPDTGVTINFNPAFQAIPALSILIQDGDAGDEIQFTRKDKTGFEFRVYNRVSMAYVERVYDFIASGYGRVEL